MKIDITIEEENLLIGILEKTLDDLSMEDSMEYGPKIRELIEKVKQ